ncbi:DUF4238 domain-containing protein [Mesoterricola silvestris]|uniref:DUF4238 domain-containing protein n=1 Tax=Mesoterricola silvestris TaxID=2927979 RepID=A0AA48KDK8_9BACT|nr:DUF4238 domain-containing protein [Mesoterricola silvestris]BDU74543.1 hypothetical protein METEAL_37170 [Mesoterricola silvestris]
MPQQSHRHHYIPEWYQRRFLAPDKTAFKILDLAPESFKDASGRIRGHSRAILDKGPDAWFWEPDLYTIRILGKEDDVIERMLFGAIDTNGRKAFDDLLNEDWDGMHESYPQLFEFLDALRLRTPKGLQFIRQFPGANSQQSLMVWMQRVRRMHCVMWMEGVREIFSTGSSTKKFIFSDHPVTLFNRLIFPGDRKLVNGSDPLLEWQGTQTIVPLDQDHLFVLTHLEWGRCQKPGPYIARQPRTNHRYFDNPLVSYHDIERSRSLTDEQILEVNYIIKNRAFRYIAGQEESDLFPESELKTTMWNKLGTFLMPPESRVAMSGGQMFAKMKDGSEYFQDEFGRRPKTLEEWKAASDEMKRMEEHFHSLMKKQKSQI